MVFWVYMLCDPRKESAHKLRDQCGPRKQTVQTTWVNKWEQQSGYFHAFITPWSFIWWMPKLLWRCLPTKGDYIPNLKEIKLTISEIWVSKLLFFFLLFSQTKKITLTYEHVIRSCWILHTCRASKGNNQYQFWCISVQHHWIYSRLFMQNKIDLLIGLHDKPLAWATTSERCLLLARNVWNKQRQRYEAKPNLDKNHVLDFTLTNTRLSNPLMQLISELQLMNT